MKPGSGQLGLPIGEPASPPQPRRRVSRIPVRSVPSAPRVRGHGPTRARKVPGELQGPAPTSRQVRKIPVLVEQLDGGMWRFTMPRAPGWAAVARNPVEATHALRRAFTEAQVAAYSDWRQTLYDSPEAAGPEFRRSRPKARSARRCDTYHPTEWRLDVDGRWVSPRGLRYPESRQVVQRVMAARRQMGLTARPDPVQPEPEREVS